MFKLFLIYCLFVTIINCDNNNVVNNQSDNVSISSDCVKNPLTCQGFKIAKNVVKQALQSHGDIELGDGIHIVKSDDNVIAEGRSASPVAGDDGLINTIQNYLVNHELRIKLPDILPNSEGIRTSLKSFVDDFTKPSTLESRGKKDKGGGAMLLVMAMMMGKMLMTMGFGGIGLMAMKALMVSALALMLSTILGIKKLASSGQEESGHQVIYAGHGHDSHHRKRRSVTDGFDNSIPLPYRGWVEYIKQLQ